MTLLRVQSERTDSKGVPYTDYYLGWKDNEGVKLVRVRYVFKYDRRLFEQIAVAVPVGEEIAKYVD